MARKRRNRNSPIQRNAHRITTGTIQRPVLYKIVIKPKDLTSVEDRRRFSPARVSPPRMASSKRALIKPTLPKFPKLAFALPKNAIICIRRKMRRQVLFAANKTSKGARKRHRRFTPDSHYKC